MGYLLTNPFLNDNSCDSELVQMGTVVLNKDESVTGVSGSMKLSKQLLE